MLKQHRLYNYRLWSENVQCKLLEMSFNNPPRNRFHKQKATSGGSALKKSSSIGMYTANQSQSVLAYLSILELPLPASCHVHPFSQWIWLNKWRKPKGFHPNMFSYVTKVFYVLIPDVYFYPGSLRLLKPQMPFLLCISYPCLLSILGLFSSPSQNSACRTDSTAPGTVQETMMMTIQIIFISVAICIRLYAYNIIWYAYVSMMCLDSQVHKYTSLFCILYIYICRYRCV